MQDAARELAMPVTAIATTTTRHVCLPEASWLFRTQVRLALGRLPSLAQVGKI